MRRTHIPPPRRVPGREASRRGYVARLSAPVLTLSLLLLSTCVPAHAYIDPGAGPLLWQMLAAGFAGLLYQVSRWFRRSKRPRGDSDQEDA